MRTRLIIALTALLLAAPVAAHAERVALLPTSGVNVHEGYLAAAHAVARGHLETTGYEVVPVPGNFATNEPSAGDAIAAARQSGARYAVVIYIARLGSAAKVKLTAYDAASGRVAYRDQLDAGTPDDMDPVLARLVKGMATGKRASETADINTVTQKEADPLRKRKATSVFGLRIGVVVPATRPDSGNERGIPGMGIFWLYDARSFLAEVAFDFHAKDEEGDFTVGIGAYRPFNKENTSFYAGGGLRYGSADYGSTSMSSGISAYAGLGVLLGRLSTVQIRGEVDYFVNLFQDGADGDESNSSGLLLNVGVGF